jgi:hypothetical protein
MSFVRYRSSVLTFCLAAGLAGVLLAGPSAAAGQAAPKLSGQKARVAQGVRVDLAASSLTAVELASLRPEYDRLKPRARTTAD